MLETLNFDNRFVGELPADPETKNYVRQVSRACYSRVLPTPVAKPELISYAREVAGVLELDDATCATDDFAAVFAGNRQVAGMDPYAMCYGGHQFGNWAGQLGDGRAINLGEVVNSAGQRWVLQLKGTGPTPYSRTADGLAVLRSSVREFLCSEAMYHLGVPTTRALSLILTGEQVMRDMLYDGNPELEPGAVVCRVAPSFTRFGNFQIFTARKELDVLKQLTDYTLVTDFPHLGEPAVAVYIEWFREVCSRTVEMIVHWMRVGFVHGVMNTDNMSIMGLTIDYGPYGWLEDFDLNWTPNTTDANGRRYRFGTQPQIAQWNLLQLAQAIYPLINQVEPLQEILDNFITDFECRWQDMMAEKLGLDVFVAATDEPLTKELGEILQLVETDMTIFYRLLPLVDSTADPATMIDTTLLNAYYQPEQLNSEYRERMTGWLTQYQARIGQDDLAPGTRRQRMYAVNPKYVMRNYLAQLAIDKAAMGDYNMVNELLDVMRHPYDEQPDKEEYAQKRPDWARHRAGCSMLSCSS